MAVRIHRYWVVAICLVLGASYAHSFDAARSEIGWVGLYNEEMVAWLENQNRIDELCPSSLGPAFQQCREEKLKARTWTLDVREKPETASLAVGTITMTATPGVGLTAALRTSNAVIPFTPDLFEVDWGYGPYFHQTFRARRDSWVLLPKNPLTRPGWIDISQLTKTPDIQYIAGARVYTLDGKGIVITRIQNEKVTIRPEQPADMWCEAGEPPKLKQTSHRELPLSALLTHDGHLKLKIKYTKGC